VGEDEVGKADLGQRNLLNVQIATKRIRRDRSQLHAVYREISILRLLQHPNIVRFHGGVETDRHIDLFFEYASGGNLLDYVDHYHYLKESSARRLFAQLIAGVGYLHNSGVVHRNLKLENLLLDRNLNVIITGFNIANKFRANDELGMDIEMKLDNQEHVKEMGLDVVGEDGCRPGDIMQTSCGSECYAAPELVVSDSLYTGRKVDIWSCGVILVRKACFSVNGHEFNHISSTRFLQDICLGMNIWEKNRMRTFIFFTSTSYQTP
jgi:protein-serine/threonine kinase